MEPLRILVIATKPPWPPVDGGRLVLLQTIEALAGMGHRVDLVTPAGGEIDEIADALAPICTPHLVPATPRSAFGSLVRGLAAGVPATVARHSIPAVRRVVDRLLTDGGVDVVHAEQLHALPQAETAHRMGVPVVHRAHNVESMLWAYSASHRGPIASPFFALEARRMSVQEADALASTACTIALTEPDRRALSELDPGASIHTVPAPFPVEMAAGGGPLDGEPAVVTLTSSTWAPSRDAAEHLATRVWPTVRRTLPGAVLHIFGAGHHLDGLAGVVPYPSPDDSRTAFPAGAIVLVPERHPTGVPMKALEAWARGLPLLVNQATAEILDAEDSRELLVAADADETAAALGRLSSEPGLRKRLVDGGREKLRSNHDPARVAEHLTRIYRWAIDR